MWNVCITPRKFPCAPSQGILAHCFCWPYSFTLSIMLYKWNLADVLLCLASFTQHRALRFTDIIAQYLLLFNAEYFQRRGHNLLIPSLVRGYVGCLHHLAAVNTAAINIHGFTFSFLLGLLPKLFSWLFLPIKSSTVLTLFHGLVQITFRSCAPLSAKWGYLQISLEPLWFLALPGLTLFSALWNIFPCSRFSPIIWDPSQMPPFHKLSRTPPLEVISHSMEFGPSVFIPCLYVL